jgi:hypothetical protein
VRLPTSGAPLPADAINSYPLLTLVFNAHVADQPGHLGMLAHHRLVNLHAKGFF